VQAIYFTLTSRQKPLALPHANHRSLIRDEAVQAVVAEAAAGGYAAGGDATCGAGDKMDLAALAAVVAA